MTGSNEATVLEIQRMSTEDGPGIRTTVFFKGCSLKCKWCHNPESISKHPQIHWIGNRCIGCHICLETCPNQALHITDKGISIQRSICEGCGNCAEACPSTAMELMGTQWPLEELVNEVIKDKAYFDKSDGGITISGGEPTLQADFASQFLKRLKEKGIQTALDTCGLCSKKALEKILPYTTMVLFDIKEINSLHHQQITGYPNEKILNNLIFIGEFIKNHVHPKTLWIRTPIIPGTTDSPENIHGIGEFISKNLGNIVNRWELCAFNNLCKDKYDRLGLTWEYADSSLMTVNRMEQLAAIARNSGVEPDIVHWSGSTKLEKEMTETSKDLNQEEISLKMVKS